MSKREAYQKARERYHAAGKAAKGADRGSVLWERYQKARTAYLRAGEAVKAAKG